MNVDAELADHRAAGALPRKYHTGVGWMTDEPV